MSSRRSGGNDLWVLGGLWLGLTLVGEWVAGRVSMLPIEASREAEIIDGAFLLLLRLAIPVFAFILAVLLLALVRFRGDGVGPPIYTDPRVTWTWLLVTGALAVFVVFNPGLKGLAELRAEPEADLTIDVTARQWSWDLDYVAEGVKIERARRLVVPAGARVRFNVTSEDVIHSFWVPAWRIKADAVPGRIHTILVTPTTTGSFAMDPAFRVQCAELCGTGHARMRMTVEVVDADAFADRLAEVASEG